MSDHILLIIGMTLVTYIPKALPLMLLSSRTLPERFMRWLEMIPPAVLAALLAPELLLQTIEGKKVFFLAFGNVFLLASIPTLVIGWFTRSFFGTVAFGMATVGLLRYLGQ